MPSTKRIFTLRLTDDDYEKMRIIAEKDNRSMANYIEWLVKQCVTDWEAKHGEIALTEDKGT